MLWLPWGTRALPLGIAAVMGFRLRSTRAGKSRFLEASRFQEVLRVPLNVSFYDSEVRRVVSLTVTPSLDGGLTCGRGLILSKRPVFQVQPATAVFHTAIRHFWAWKSIELIIEDFHNG